VKKLLFAAVMLTAGALIMIGAGAYRNSETQKSKEGTLTIVASLFPQYDFARVIAGDRAEVVLLLPPGMESHTFDPRPSDMAKIYGADLFLYTGKYMEPWAERVISGAKDGGAEKLTVADVSSGVALAENDHDDHDHHEGHEGHSHAYDPHIWLDPTLAMKMADNIADALCGIDPEYADTYRANASAYRAELERLDADTAAVVKAGKRNTLVFGGRFAYAYFLKHYGLRYVTAYETCSTESEPGVRDVARVISFVRENGVPLVFHEEFVDPVVARSIAEQSGASLALFSTAHNVTKDELDNGVTFIEIMRGNLGRIERGLN